MNHTSKLLFVALVGFLPTLSHSANIEEYLSPDSETITAQKEQKTLKDILKQIKDLDLTKENELFQAARLLNDHWHFSKDGGDLAQKCKEQVSELLWNYDVNV